MRGPSHRSLADLAAHSGVAVPCAGNLPAAIDDPHMVWFIDEGAVDLFLIESRDGVEQSAPQHVLRAGAGRLLPGVAPQEGDTTLGLVAKGLPDTVLRRLPAADLAAVRGAELAEQADAWLTDLSAMLARGVAHRPRPDTLVEPGVAVAAAEGTLSARRGVVWVSEPPAGAGLFLSLIDPAESRPDGEAAAGVIPLTPASWLTLMEETRLSARSSEALADENALLPALASFHATAFALERLNRRLAVLDQANLAWARATSRRTDEEGARQRLFDLYGLLDEEAAGAGESALLEALAIIARHEGIDFNRSGPSGTSDPAAVLAHVLDASGVRGRRVRLDPQDRWWTGDSGAMLAFRADGGRPVALLPGAPGRYREVDPVSRRSARLTTPRAESLRSDAWVFYRPLPAAGVGPRDLLRLARQGLTAELAGVVAAGLPGGLVMLLPAVILGFIAGEVIPAGDYGLLYAATATLAAFAVIGSLLHVAQGMALMRLEGRAVSRIEAAFWDRLLRLPPSFLHRYPAGDLATRGMTFQHLRDAVQGVVADAALSVVFLLPAFIVIFFHDAVLGGVALAFGLLSLIVTVVLGLRQIAPRGRVIRAAQRVVGRLFQLVNGISKLRVDGAEGSGFAVWARDYREQKEAELEFGAAGEHLQALGVALPLLAGAALLLAVSLSGRGAVAVGDFLVAYTAFMVFQAAVARLGTSFGAVASIMPTLEQIRPFLAEPVERDADGEPVERLDGNILFDHVSFRYDPDGPLILDDVSIHVRPGEFVAIAGASGSGKSTLFRLALGLNRPSAGAVYYDGRDLAYLNVRQVRRRIGTVPQDVRLHPQDLLDNIVANHADATLDEAWEAARTAAVDREIMAMPMGILTPVGASAAVTSGGESQRIAIARALMRKPRILLLDEATNWLDNDSQARVMANLAGLTSTRIVIAHRLSTLRQADRIYVMRSGKVVQEGSFAELSETEGVFRDLIRRQIA